MKIQHYFPLVMLFCIAFFQGAITHAQTVRGVIKDADTKEALVGASVQIMTSDHSVIGAVTNMDGEFSITNAPLGRQSLQISFVGYEPKLIHNIIISRAKEAVISEFLKESSEMLESVDVVAQTDKAISQNEFAVVSARTFSVEETERMPGGLSDPSRMLTTFAGVTMGSPEGNNDIVVRGNSPRGLQWRLEGMPIPNPNHFANEGGTGGGISALNSAMLANSDFYMGAFPAEYGNATSGIFNIQLKEGNNQQTQFGFELGALGTDLTAEGPFTDSGNNSFIVNYRYSSLGLLHAAGLRIVGDNIPNYQDGSFKLKFDLGKKGEIIAYGLGGYNSIDQKESTADGLVYEDIDFTTSFGIVGLQHNLSISPKTKLETTFQATSKKSDLIQYMLDSPTASEMHLEGEYASSRPEYRMKWDLTHKLNNKHKFKVGALWQNLNYDIKVSIFEKDFNQTITYLDDKGSSNILETYGMWKYAVNNRLSLNSGVHLTHFRQTEETVVEPRFSLQYSLGAKDIISIGYGLHSNAEDLSVYLTQVVDENGNTYQPNLDLRMAKSEHYVIGYQHFFSDQLNFKAEAYYQRHYDVPVINDENRNESSMNITSGDELWGTELLNEGTGRNVGVELTLEKYFMNGYYYLLSGTVYDAKYTALDGVERNSHFNGNYAGNLVGGKEWQWETKKGKSKTFGVGGKFALMGGYYYTPIDEEASLREEQTVFVEDEIYSLKGDDIMRIDLQLNLITNKKKSTHTWSLDIQNVTNVQTSTHRYYNRFEGQFKEIAQMGFLPNLSYRVEF
ncbi:TonB-dependent receptor [Sediminitomix flava]|uniref:Outer membrane receptor protein involved in Fe transport n=1 Tax=Sediminitomix flava TaxID=379075 RepID=A0A315ZJ98_SEDFL|nr:TonB-dependent receptor [Sediminitomix flava]PWJ44764.1 outer membrane receptor protein involved in Fe transport [Sediminitomix flava]